MIAYMLAARADVQSTPRLVRSPVTAKPHSKTSGSMLPFGVEDIRPVLTAACMHMCTKQTALTRCLLKSINPADQTIAGIMTCSSNLMLSCFLLLSLSALQHTTCTSKPTKGKPANKKPLLAQAKEELLRLANRVESGVVGKRLNSLGQDAAWVVQYGYKQLLGEYMGHLFLFPHMLLCWLLLHSSERAVRT